MYFPRMSREFVKQYGMDICFWTRAYSFYNPHILMIAHFLRFIAVQFGEGHGTTNLTHYRCPLISQGDLREFEGKTTTVFSSKWIRYVTAYLNPSYPLPTIRVHPLLLLICSRKTFNYGCLTRFCHQIKNTPHCLDASRIALGYWDYLVYLSLHVHAYLLIPPFSGIHVSCNPAALPRKIRKEFCAAQF